MSRERAASPQAAREAPEPIEGREPAPIFVWVTGFAVALFGFAYYGFFTGRFTADEGDSRTAQLVAASRKGPPDGAAVFARICSACHQPTGLGVLGVYPPLARSSWVLGEAGTPIRIVLLGVSGEIDVEGHTYRGLMPTWRAALDDEEVAAVLTYVRSHFGNEAPPVDAAAVAALRALYASRSTPWTGGAELEQAAKQAPGRQP